jgi:DNA primase
VALFPQSFIDDLRGQADILRVVEERVPLKRAGTSYRGLCPFHAEKTPSFHVHPERGFFHCFGCGVGGDVFKFVGLYEKVGFQEAVGMLAERLGVPVPSAGDARRDGSADAEREALLKIHELAATHFREQLAGPAGGRAREHLRQRGVSGRTVEALGFGFAPAIREGLKGRLLGEGFPLPLLLRSGLVVERDGGQIVDRFRNRLMVPICRDAGSVIAFGGRALEAEQQPKYLNSPETPIYSKGRTLYGLHLTRTDIRRLGYAVLVEGYFDFAQALQAGVAPVLATCGTALTPAQAHVLRRYTRKVILSYDPDAAGQGAAARSSELLVAEGFQVNVAMLSAGEDPDTFVRAHGGEAYVGRLRDSRPYLEYLLERSAAQVDLATDEGRGAFLTAMLAVAARIPEAAARDRFADRVAHRARITEEVVRAEIRKAAVSRRPAVGAVAGALLTGIRPVEKALIWTLMRTPEAGLKAVAGLEPADLEGLAAGGILRLAGSLVDWPAASVPDTLIERLSREEARLAKEVAAQTGAPASSPEECVRVLKRLRCERERAELQREIDRLQELGATRHDDEITALFARKERLWHRIEELGA